MAEVFALLAVAASIATLVCSIMVVVRTFQHGQSALAICCLLLHFLFGLGVLFALVFGWVKAAEWNMRRLMWIFTGCVVVAAIASFLAGNLVSFPHV